MNNEKEISFGAFDSELMHQEIFIPEGFEATIDGNKIILKKKESKDERIRKELIGYFTGWSDKHLFRGFKAEQILTWLEKQGEHKKFRDSIQVGDEVTRNRDGVIVNLSQLNRVAKKGEQKLPIEKLPEEMKTIGESLGFTTQKECDEYNKMVSDLIMSDGNEIKPNFEVGDTIRLKNSTAEYTIESISDGCYHGKGWSLNIIDADKSGDYVLVEHKYTLSDEDEKIRKAILELVRQSSEVLDKQNQNNMIAWLEKQGGQKSTEWDEYDEMYVNALVAIVRKRGATDERLRDELIGWLSCLKCRLGE
jgi:hydrogenase maturation factor